MGDGADAGGGGELSDNTAKIRDAVSSLPQLLEQKRQLKEHMTVLMAVMESIKGRGLDDYYGAEEEILNEQKLTRPLMDLIGVSGPGSPEDKVRLLVIYLLAPHMQQVGGCAVAAGPRAPRRLTTGLAGGGRRLRGGAAGAGVRHECGEARA